MVAVELRSRKGLAKVTFSCPESAAQTMHVVGDFNDWRPIHAMKRTADGGWRLTLELERGRQYQYRFLQDGTVWINDPEAAQSVPNPYGGENSLLAT